MNGEFKSRALALFRAGHRVVPIPHGQKGVLIQGWTDLADTQDEKSVLDLIRKANGCGVGILSKWTSGCDIDVRDYELAQRLAGLAHSMLGPTVERIGQAPKLLLPYRVEKPFAKIATRGFRLPGDAPDAKPHKVEILADGQQWIAYHVHPDTQRPYHWPDGDLPDRDELPEITVESARLFIARAEELIIAAGGRFEARLAGATSAGGKSSAFGQAGTYEAVADALRYIPNPDLSYDDWVQMGLAIKGALGDGVDAWELFTGWSEQSGKYELKETEKLWKSRPPDHIGAGTIYRLAAERGWKPNPQLALNPEKAERKARQQPGSDVANHGGHKGNGQADTATSPQPEPHRPPLMMFAGHRDQTVSACIAALNKASYENSLFSRGNIPVVVKSAEEDLIKETKTTTGETKISHIIRKGSIVTKGADSFHTLHALDNLLLGQRLDKKGNLKNTDIPEGVAKLALKNGQFRPLLKVVTTPTLRGDGSILTKEGYDPASCLIYKPDDIYPSIIQHPSPEDAQRALKRLLLPFRAIPFETDPAESVFLALVLTLLTRHLYATAPGFIHRAAEAGTGKTLIADAACMIATGVAAANSSGETLGDPDELRKLLTTWTGSGVALGMFDNVTRGQIVDSALINRFLTTDMYSDRWLGGNEAIHARVVTTIVITGNRIEVKGDATRRFLMCDLDAKVEHPEYRLFDFQLKDEIERDRPQLVGAALTLLRAHVVAGRPVPEECETPLGGFERWCQAVRNPLVWAGASDPVTTITKSQGGDEERSNLEIIASEIRRAFGFDSRLTATIIIAKTENFDYPHKDALKEALVSVAVSKSGGISRERLGSYLRSNVNRVISLGETSARLESRPDTVTKTAGYMLRKVR